VRLTTGPGADESPSIAADGTIAFLSSRWKNVLEVYPLAGGSPKVLASHVPFLWGPTVSPDGREVAFSRAEVDGSWHIWTVPMDGGEPRRVTNSEAGEVYGRYTPDGTRILFHTWTTPRHIGRVPRGGGPPEILSFGKNTSDAYADMSPDGRQIVLTRTEADAERLYTAPAAGGEARLLTRTPGAVARWSPDGTQIAFSATRAYTGGVFVIDANGTNERQLTRDGGWPVWWPGRGIAYLALAPDGSQEIRIVPVAGGTPERFDQVRFVGSNHPFDVSRPSGSLVTTNGVLVSDEIWLLEPRK
jgi:Tol biopolymer transport system component